MFWDEYGDDEIPEYGYTVGDFSPAGRGEAQMAMVRDRDAAMRRMQNANVHPDIKAGWLMNTQGQWTNALQTAAASQWFNGYFRPGRDTVAKPFIMQGATVPGADDDDGPAFRPGLTGALRGVPLFRPYNNGDYSTQKGGVVGPHFQKPVRESSSVWHVPAVNQIGPDASNPAWLEDGQQETYTPRQFAPNYFEPMDDAPPRNSYSTLLPNGHIRINGDGREVDPDSGVTVWNPNKLGPKHNLSLNRPRKTGFFGGMGKLFGR